MLGRATLPHLRRFDVTGMTRSPERLPLLHRLGAEAVVCDVYDYDALLAVAQNVQPEVVVNFVTDLGSGSAGANTRARREGGVNLLNAAEAIGAARLVVESVAFALDGDAAAAVEELEQNAQGFRGDTVILRFGRLWGPGTFYDSPPRLPAIHIDSAGEAAARLLVQGPPGIFPVSSRHGPR